ncbi:hypothetical protein JTE90_002262 [Oedothorax gibbosus]|uniref:Uncharacterized protein n=1 Tax=Oedothorax gibbosus TaxID=931172 RepID=A0AAV6V671_9ARAC|nr:hypothetical protein JTE90_002262 [Oedothorax gibbosus]
MSRFRSSANEDESGFSFFLCFASLGKAEKKKKKEKTGKPIVNHPFPLGDSYNQVNCDAQKMAAAERVFCFSCTRMYLMIMKAVLIWSPMDLKY